MTGDGEVRIYVDGEYDMKGQATWGTKNQVDSLFVYSKEVDRITEFYGVLYTDALSVQGAGGGGPSNTDLYGAIIATSDKIDTAGQLKVEYGDALDGIVLEEVEVEYALILYLHVSENVVKVD
ncbi:MAG: hypothetical protein V5A55_14935 [Halovenus sp.]